MLKTARTTALVIVPLAAAVSAHASTVVLPTGNPTCSTNLSGSCPGGVEQLADLGSGVQGVSLFMNSGGQTFFASSGSHTGLDLALSASGLLVNGPLAGGTAIPVGWNFTLTSTSGSIGTWNLTFELGSSEGGSDFGSVGVNGSGGGTFVSTPGTFLDVAAGGIASGSTVFEEAILTFNASTNGPPLDVFINVPAGTSFDFNSTPAASTPEPSSLGIMAAGLAFLGGLFRRRKQ